ncbi:nucleotide-binding universal stress UspA family protein [Trueperella bonasi]|uniref:Nucleotide-binding universal stress UspA family protein n=1 Tax=Trueperella bonasi TaxID=312286 RepID=A0ABT9NI89_9ACTO|nr:universal stress protein [Trueperella bonasi]MDP9807116.1 nucleotide-binding universal stress UspA family protein [Trueperella bonasi]
MTVVVPVLDDAKDEALRVAIQIARRESMPLVALLNRPVSEFDQESVDAEIDALSDRLDREDIAYSTEVRLASQDLGASLAEVATHVEASIVVVSLAQRPTNGKLLLGSQIQRLLVESPCSVLVVREGTAQSCRE